MNFLFGCSIKIGKLQMLIGSSEPTSWMDLCAQALIRHRSDHFVSFFKLVQLHTADTRFGVLTSHFRLEKSLLINKTGVRIPPKTVS
jgi:hypothetical protein